MNVLSSLSFFFVIYLDSKYSGGSNTGSVPTSLFGTTVPTNRKQEELKASLQLFHSSDPKKIKEQN
jgi:hypothetical protein